MLRTISTIALVALMSGSAFAASSACSTASVSKYKPKSQLTAMLNSKGYKVHRIKTESGCYEVYASDKHGKKVNMAYNAETLKKAHSAEAGEN